MQITLLRHAAAVDRSLSLPDPQRALSEKGEKQLKRLSAFCLLNDLIPSNLFASPLLRAQQTAQGLQQRLPGCPAVQTADWLIIHTTPPQFFRALGKLAEQGLDDIWLVGHEPDFSELIAALLQTESASIVIKKASLTRLEVELSARPSAKLLWSVPSSLMAVGS
ncbi:histidine phosphatase family protein [Methylomonas paludis]|uniref:Histidine phosphatase family protein n=1 Tax=Methylomonas paludis TaxID=1173101 RepID=A0A975MLK4_9GAMM|nr:histidine phosphatase family protein [Methylomonas paludis]QWF70138.1 histidine phosphatase family protein [Methylomonas paludis]